MSFILMILAALLVFGAVILVHELGHFIAAKLSGIRVNEFALGMGPAVFKRQKGDTLYAVRLFPIGGFVLMEGEDEESGDARRFQSAALWKRIAVIVAGALMNFVLGFAALLVVVGAGQARIASRTVAEVSVPATGLVAGDEIVRVNGRAMFTFSDIDYEFLRTQNGTLNLEVKRDGRRVRLDGVAFEVVTATDPETGEPVIIEATGQPYEYLNLGFKVWAKEKTVWNVMSEAFCTMLSYARVIYLTLFDLAAGRTPINQLSGPVGIVSEIGQAVAMGWLPVVQLLALITVNLGVVNMLPLPALDGGKTLLLVIEGIRKKPIPVKYESVINLVGFALLIGLMVFVSFNDIRRLFF